MILPRLFQGIATDLQALGRQIEAAGLLAPQGQVGLDPTDPPAPWSGHLRMAIAALLADPRRAEAFSPAPRLRLARQGSVLSIELESRGRVLSVRIPDGMDATAALLRR